MQPAAETSEQVNTIFGRPSLIFFTELDDLALRETLYANNLLDELAAQQYGVALAMLDLSDERAAVVRQLNARGIRTIGWLLLPPGEGFWFNLQNYPQAIERYRAFRDWVQLNQLHFDAVGLDIEPPVSEVSHIQQWNLKDFARRIRLASENVLYPAARAAYTDLVAEIHQDGYEVHTYQLPLLADDRRAGTTLVQRALDIIDLPADVEVLMCYSSLPVEQLNNDLGGALIASYGPDADGIGVGSVGGRTMLDIVGEGLPPLPWEAIERDLLLAAQYTDTIYLFSLEGFIERGLLPRLASLRWDNEPSLILPRRVLVSALRSVLLVVLLATRFSRILIAWLGWVIAVVLLFQRVRQRWRERGKQVS